MNAIIAPSILAADFGRLHDEVQAVLEAGADWIHIDVMDGTFVPNITMGTNVVQALRKRFSCVLDVHLMVQNPERHIEAFAQSGADVITIHAEATPHVHRAIQQIHHHEGIKAGLALNPGTGLDALTEMATDIDLLLIMTVNPGFGGQPFLHSTLSKIQRAQQLLASSGRDVAIEVDGGIDATTISHAQRAGASVFVAGSSIFGQPMYGPAIAALRDACEKPE